MAFNCFYSTVNKLLYAHLDFPKIKILLNSGNTDTL